MRPHPATARTSQTGAVSLVAVLWIGIALICLMAIDIGHVFWQQREVQRMADMAALAGAGSTEARCAANASDNARANGLSDDPAVDTVTPECGNWDPAQGGSGDVPPQFFAQGRSPFNAARVTVSREVPYFFVFSAPSSTRRVTAHATAATRDIASFTVGTGIARLQDGLVNGLLNALLGTGNRIGLDAISYQGLVKSPIRLLDLIEVMPGVGSVEELLDARVQLGDLALAMVNAMDSSNTLAVSAINHIIGANIRSAEVTMGDVLKVMTPTPESAANASVSAFDMLMISAQVANGRNAIHLDADIHLGAVATAKATLIIAEPPSIAIGEAGQDSDGNWRTQAHSASVRLLLDARILSTSGIPGLSSLLNVSLLRLPIYIEAAPGHGRLTDIHCAPQRIDCRVTIEARPGLASICIAGVDDTLLSNVETPVDCASLPSTRISEIRALGIPILGIEAKVPVQAEIPSHDYEALTYNGVIGDADDVQTTNANAAGSVLTNTLGNFTSASTWTLTPVVLGFLPVPVGSILSPILNFTLNTLAPLFTALDAVAVPLLNLLGVQLGYSDIHHQSLVCGEPHLVY